MTRRQECGKEKWMRKCENQRIERGIGGKSSKSFGRRKWKRMEGREMRIIYKKKKVTENGKM